MAVNPYNINNQLNLTGQEIKDWRGDMLTTVEITAIENGITGGTITKESQESRKVYDKTKHIYMRFNFDKGKFELDGANGADTYRGYLDRTVTTETDTVKKNPPALANCKAGDVWVVRTAGLYTYVDKDGTTVSVQADIGDIFRVIIASTNPDVLDWMYQENMSNQKELVIEYNSTSPELQSWEFSESGSGAFLVNIWKNGYLCQCYKEVTVTGVTTRTPTFDKISLIKDASGTEITYKAKVDFGHPLTSGDKYVFVIS